MKIKKILPLLVLLTLAPTGTTGQTPRRKPAASPTSPARNPASDSKPTTAQPTATPPPIANRTQPAPVPVVSVNGQTITTGDFDPTLRQQLESLPDRIAEQRRNILDVQINTLLLEVEAKKRRMTSHQLYELEVVKRIPVFTPAQIKKFLDDNKSQFEGLDTSTATTQASAILHDEMENRLADDLVARLRKTNPVVMGVDINTPNLNDAAVVATVGGQPIRAAVLNERLKPIIYKLKLAAYDATRQKGEQMVDDILLLAEANRRQVGPEQIVRTEISEKIRQPTEAEVTKFYSDNKARITGDLNTVRNQLVNYLQDEERQRLEKDFSARLRKGADIRWLIMEPPQPVQAVSVDDDPSKGDVNAPVTVVEFTDFQCPACAAMQPVLEKVLQSYGNKVRFVVRDFPLAQHENARKAAEAADAANAQGRFFEYTSLLFKRQNELDIPSLKKYASELGLNRAKFDSELDRGVYADEVKHDIEDGEIYGISSTPTIFINGVMLRILSEDGLREAIEKAAGPKTAAPPQ